MRSIPRAVSVRRTPYTSVPLLYAYIVDVSANPQKWGFEDLQRCSLGAGTSASYTAIPAHECERQITIRLMQRSGTVILSITGRMPTGWPDCTWRSCGAGKTPCDSEGQPFESRDASTVKNSCHDLAGLLTCFIQPCGKGPLN